MEDYVNFAVEKTVELLAIDSPTGYTDAAEEFVRGEFEKLGFSAKRTVKGGVLIDLGGADARDALLLEAHTDTLGGMVAEIKGDGRLRIVNVGGMNANNAEAENCRVVTKVNASIHVNGEYNNTKRAFDCMEVVLDEPAASAEDVKKLGISVGDFVCFEPRTRVTKSGYIKSRFLDDKLSVGILLGHGLRGGRPRRCGLRPGGRDRGNFGGYGLRGHGPAMHRAAGLHLRQGFRRPVLPRGRQKADRRGEAGKRRLRRGHLSALRLRRGSDALGRT